jgi:hypothetical protein
MDISSRLPWMLLRVTGGRSIVKSGISMEGQEVFRQAVTDG